jgi:hypothetical protein
MLYFWSSVALCGYLLHALLAADILYQLLTCLIVLCRGYISLTARLRMLY